MDQRLLGVALPAMPAAPEHSLIYLCCRVLTILLVCPAVPLPRAADDMAAGTLLLAADDGAAEVLLPAAGPGLRIAISGTNAGGSGKNAGFCRN